MSDRLPIDERLLEESAEDLYENAPCGYLSTDAAGRIVKVNATFLRWTRYTREGIHGRRFQDVLTAGGRIYYETHLAPLLRMQGAVREVAVEIVREDGSRLPALLNAVAHQTADGTEVVRVTVFDATDRRRYEQELLAGRRREHDIVATLQASLLSGELPAAAGIDIGIAYRAAGQGLDVGGDWYDAFWLSAGQRIALVVGDVVGRGIEAAATMGQLRSAVRALAVAGLPPSGLLDTLDRFARRHAIGAGSTLVYADIDLEQDSASWACAGHPPPILLPAGGAPRLVWEGRSPPVDAWFDDRSRSQQADLPFRAGDGLVLYTDGLVERRGSTITDGMESLLAEATRRAAEDATSLAGSLLQEFGGDRHKDDLCVLVFRRSLQIH